MTWLTDRVAVVTGASGGIGAGLAAYCVSKHAMRALTEVIQDGNHTNGIKAWVVCPGFVDTDMRPEILVRTMRNPMSP